MRAIICHAMMAMAAFMVLAATPATVATAAPTPKLVLLYYHADW